MNMLKKAEWVLRIAVFGTFLGHGVFALQGKEGWFKYFDAVGISNPDTITTLLLLIGIMDVILAILVLLKPIKVVLIWMAIWAFWTTLLRWPIGPDPIWDFFERWANWGAPLALMFIRMWSKSGKE